MRKKINNIVVPSKQFNLLKIIFYFNAVAPKIQPFHFMNGLQEGGRVRVACTASLGDLPIK